MIGIVPEAEAAVGDAAGAIRAAHRDAGRRPVRCGHEVRVGVEAADVLVEVEELVRRDRARR